MKLEEVNCDELTESEKGNIIDIDIDNCAVLEVVYHDYDKEDGI